MLKIIEKFILTVVLSFIVITILKYFNCFNSICWLVAFTLGAIMMTINTIL